MKTRITKTLLDSWAYMFDCREEVMEGAREDFLTTLKREPHEPNEAQKAGLEFENLVMRIANGEQVEKPPKIYNGAVKVADIVKGGQWQMHVETDLTVDGHDFWLHGFCDVVKAGVIYDLKFKTKGFGDSNLNLCGSSYKHSAQHSAYLKCLPEAYEFVYLVSDGEDIYTEAYNRLNTRPIEEIISEFMAWMKKEPELWRMYEERWTVE